VKRLRHAWVVIALFAGALGLAAGATDAASSFDDLARDAFFRLRGPVEPGPAVVIASIDEAALRALGPWPWDSALVARVIEAIERGNPAAVAIAFPAPPGLSERRPEVVRPRALEATPLEPLPFRPVEPPEATSGIDLLPPAGTLRLVPLSFECPGETEAPSLAVAALRASGRAVDLGPDGVSVGGVRTPYAAGRAIRVNWVAGERRFAYLRASRIVEGDVPPGTFAGKIVLLGPTAPAIEPGVATPTTEGLPMPRVEVLANTLDTLIRGRGFARVPALALAAALAATLLFFAFGVRQLRPALGLVLVLAAAGAAAGACFLFFIAGIDLPVSPFFAGIGCAYAGLVVLRESEIDRGVASLLDELARLDKRFYVVEDEEGASRWERALDLASLFLEVDSLVLFRTEPDVPRIRFVAGFRATEAEIAERRRDIRRSPWRDASDPLRQIVREGFMKPELGLSSLIVPIAAVTRTLGYLVVNRKVGAEASFAADRDLVHFIAQQLGTLLQREDLSRRGARERGLAALVRSDRMGRRFESLATISRSILEKKVLLFSTLNDIEDGVIVADMFGRVVLYNARISAIAEGIGTSIEGKNLMDLLHDLGGLERPEIVRRLAAVVMGEPLSFEVRPAGKGGRYYRLALSAVRHRTSAPHAKREEGPVLGLVALFSDITTLKELDSMKTGLLNMVSYRVLNVLTSIQGYAELLRESPGLSAEEKEFAETIHSESLVLTGVFDSFHAMANLDSGAPGAKMAPVDLIGLIRRVYGEAERRIEGKNVKLVLEAPERFDIVAADEAMLAKGLGAALGFAIENAERGSALKVSIAEEERYLRIGIANRGFGVPAETLRTLFDAGPAAGASEREAPNLKVTKEVFELHGGAVKAEGAVGEGIRFYLWLPLFMRGADLPSKQATR
jgi:CHASE2 domain-containing sensor protein/signal transduction histidine kinase